MTLSAADPLNLVGILVPGIECRRFRGGSLAVGMGLRFLLQIRVL